MTMNRNSSKGSGHRVMDRVELREREREWMCTVKRTRDLGDIRTVMV